MGFIKVLLLYFNLGNLIKSRSTQKVILFKPQHLLKVKQRIAVVVDLLERLGFVKVCFTQAGQLKVGVLLLSHFGQPVEVLQG